MKICNNCHTKNNSDIIYCVHCGAKFPEKPMPFANNSITPNINRQIPQQTIYVQASPVRQTSACGIVSLIMGIFGLLSSCFLIGGLIGLVGLIFGIISCIFSKDKGFGIAGLILSILSMLGTIVIIILVFQIRYWDWY